MSRFSEVCFWSDSGPHFRSAELMHFIYHQLPHIHDARYFVNFFVEYNGKSVVDGHFGVLSRWFTEGEAVRDIHSITDLVNWFREKVGGQGGQHGGGQPSGGQQGYGRSQVMFDVYEHSSLRDTIHKLTVNNFRSFLSFFRDGNKLLASTLSTLNPLNYAEVTFKTATVKDKRQTKRAPKRRAMDIDVPVVVGPRSRTTLLKRVELTQGFPDLMDVDI